ncbi:nuclear transport factor 2 family protein [Halieaceae bacterium IMCC14734]|uniref:Nuclear transport factor 2 family protein n=1 Tax=Candidatus Litorirhabdus singularis TaxID=2518993 RepID=A0ABT3TIR6_9GAMM|nr:nuclear transport factor 2 family protein [Candidatus Litorirhabdus singularis]MCX2982223.1 nuclear transport factor 2 family protein [Candidatus Litorirhabdus singularis]
MSEAENKSLIKSFQSSLERKFKGEEVDLEPFFTQDVVWHIPQSNVSVATCVGREQVLALFSGVVSDYYQPQTLRFDYQAFTAEGDRVSMLFTLSAITARGDEYKNQYHSLFRLEAGRIAETWEVFDTAYLYAMMSPE